MLSVTLAAVALSRPALPWRAKHAHRSIHGTVASSAFALIMRLSADGRLQFAPQSTPAASRTPHGLHPPIDLRAACRFWRISSRLRLSAFWMISRACMLRRSTVRFVSLWFSRTALASVSSDAWRDVGCFKKSECVDRSVVDGQQSGIKCRRSAVAK